MRHLQLVSLCGSPCCMRHLLAHKKSSRSGKKKMFQAQPRRLFTWKGKCTFILELLRQANLLQQVGRNGVLIYHEVHRFEGNVSLGHVPNALIVAILTP